MHKFSFTARHRRLLLGFLIAGAAGAILWLLAGQGIAISCPFYQITGLQCPGCGNSRAILALLRLDIGAALGYNLMFPVEFFYLGWVIFHCCKSYLSGKRFSYQPPKVWLDAVILAAILLWWVVRNLPFPV